jgi:hypothetical protein
MYTTAHKSMNTLYFFDSFQFMYLIMTVSVILSILFIIYVSIVCVEILFHSYRDL